MHFNVLEADTPVLHHGGMLHRNAISLALSPPVTLINYAVYSRDNTFSDQRIAINDAKAVRLVSPQQ